MAQVTDPCPHWAVFRMLNENRGPQRGSQISVLRHGDQSLLYCCHSRRTSDPCDGAGASRAREITDVRMEIVSRARRRP